MNRFSDSFRCLTLGAVVYVFMPICADADNSMAPLSRLPHFVRENHVVPK